MRVEVHRMKTKPIVVTDRFLWLNQPWRESRDARIQYWQSVFPALEPATYEALADREIVPIGDSEKGFTLEPSKRN